MKKTILSLLLALLCLTACAGEETPEPAASPETVAEETASTDIVFAKRGEDCAFTLTYNVDVSTEERDDILKIRHALSDTTDVTIDPLDDFYDSETGLEIVVNSKKRPECEQLMNSLSDNQYAYKTVVDGDKTSILIAYKGGYARMCAIENFIEEYVGADEAKVPANLDVRETVKPPLVESGIRQLRDPCIVYDNGVYYAYGTGWVCYKNESGSLDGKWEGPISVVQDPANCEGDRWAPEVHKYNGAFYMFTTYRSSETGHRGCTILKSDSPLGPFVEITKDGHITPHDWDSIDGTLYIDRDGTPWMVFVHEWTCTDDGVGRMAYAKLSDDLTEFVTEPVEMFRADEPSWSTGGVTDGCWMYRTEAGSLLMIWSNWDKYGYCVGIARSESGEIEGPWVQEDKVLYSKSMLGQYDGGHGMIFTHTDGQKYLSIHSPNNAQGDRKEMPVFIPIKEENDTLVWDK